MARMTELLEVPADWVTLRTVTEDDQPIVVLVDRALAATAPYPDWPVQVAIAVSYGATPDGLPLEEHRAHLREMEQAVVDAAAGEGRLVAVMTLEGVREWMLYARSTDWSASFAAAGLSVMSADDPTWAGLRELSGS
jgi:hypothetical protein